MSKTMLGLCVAAIVAGLFVPNAFSAELTNSPPSNQRTEIAQAPPPPMPQCTGHLVPVQSQTPNCSAFNATTLKDCAGFYQQPNFQYVQCGQGAKREPSNFGAICANMNYCSH